jgi:hypothetical protein
VLDSPVLTGYGSDGFEHGSSRGGSRSQVGSNPDGLF